MSDISNVFSMIMDSARTLGLDRDDPRVREAREIAIAAVEDGRNDEDAFLFARSVLCPDSGHVAA